MGNWFSDLFKGKEETKTKEAMLTPEQKQAMSQLSSFASSGKVGGYQAGEAYGGELGNYDMTALESMGQDQLAALMNSGKVNEMFGLGKDEIRKLLTTDKYDPYSDKGVYSGMKRNILRESDEASDRLKQSQAITGDLYSTDNAKQQGLLQERTSNQLSDILAGLYDQFGARKLQGAEVAGQMGMQEEVVNQGRISASQQFGQLERMLKDAQAKEKFNEWNRSRSEWLDTLDAAKSVMGKNVSYGYKTETTRAPSTFMGMLGEVSPLIGSYNTHEYGYTGNQGSLSSSSGWLNSLLSFL